MLKVVLWWILLALLCCSAIKLLLLLDLNKRVYTHLPGRCRPVNGIRRSITDITLLPDGHAVVSTGVDLNQLTHASKKVYGHLYAFDISIVKNISLDSLNVGEVTIKVGEVKTFEKNKLNPVGMSFYQTKGVINFYIINRLLSGDTVECFVYDKKKMVATHMKSIKDAWIYNPEGIFAAGPDKFYLTNKHYFRWKALQLLEVFLMLNVGSLVYFDGKSGQVVDHRLTTPGGITMDKDLRYLFVSLGIQEVVRVYKVSQDGSVVKQADMNLLTSTSRMFVESETGDLWMTAMPVFHETLSFVDTSKIPDKISSHVLRAKMQDKEKMQWIVSEVFANDGSLVNAGQVSVYFKGYLLIGGLTGQLLICEAPVVD